MVFLLLLSKSGNQKHPNIIFITIDALRADHLGCYGYQRNTSPNIDKLASEGVMFDRCFSTSSATSYSFPGILTGRYLAVSKGDYAHYTNIFDSKFDTLAEYLKRLGYYTAAFVNNEHLRMGQGFEQGFDRYENVEDNAQALTARALDFLNNFKEKKPIFIWIHYLDTHSPYAPLQVCLNKFENDELYKKNDRILKVRRSNDMGPFASDGDIPKIVFQDDRHNLSYYIARYDASIFYTDFYVGELVKEIRDNAIIILTADHGESLGEHGRCFTHGQNIYDEVLHVPLIFKDKRYFKAGKKILPAVSSVDIVPTILGRLDCFWYFFNKNRFNGVDLFGLLNGGNSGRRYIYSYFPWDISIRDVKKNLKFILNKGGKEELYFLPNEKIDYVEDKSSWVVKIKERLRRDLRKWYNRGYPIVADKDSKEATLDSKSEDRLKSLGYLQ